MHHLILIAIMLGTMFVTNRVSAAKSEQITSMEVEYSNDTFSKDGKIVGCVVTLVVVVPGDPRTQNFQFFGFKDALGWKLTGGLLNFAAGSMTALHARDGLFSSSLFLIPSAFKKTITPEGQLIGMLVQPNQAAAFNSAFFHGPFTVEVSWEETKEALSYYIDKPPPLSIKNTFLRCFEAL